MKWFLFIALIVLGACSHHGKKHDCNCDKQKAVVAAPVEFDGHCAHGLCMKKEKVKCDPTITAAYKGKSYCFSNLEARDHFMKDIEKNVKKAHDNWADIMAGAPRG